MHAKVNFYVSIARFSVLFIGIFMRPASDLICIGRVAATEKALSSFDLNRLKFLLTYASAADGTPQEEAQNESSWSHDCPEITSHHITHLSAAHVKTRL